MQTPFTLPPHEEKKLSVWLKQNPKGHQLNRIRFVQYKLKGMKHADISMLLGKCPKTLTNWVQKLATDGLEAFVFVDYNRHTSRLAPLAEAMKKEIREHGFTSLSEMVAWAKKQAVETGISNMHYFIKKNLLVPSKKQY